MTDGEALLAAIIAHPDEDVPRLAYADYIEEWEPDRAAMIRRGVETRKILYADNVSHQVASRHVRLAKWVTVPGGARTPGCQAVIQRIMPRPTVDARFNLQFRRGFLDHPECPAAWWLAHADAILAQNPVQEVTLTTMPEFRYNADGLHQLHGRDASHMIPRGEAYDHSARGIAETLLRAEWPTVKAWNFPRQQPESLIGTTWDANGGESYTAFVEQQRREIAESIGIPPRLTSG